MTSLILNNFVLLLLAQFEEALTALLQIVLEANLLQNEVNHFELEELPSRCLTTGACNCKQALEVFLAQT
jgi:hypothetical protein